MQKVPEKIVHAAIQVARRRGESVSDVPLSAIADAVGISRSTLLRRLGGKRTALDDVIAARGVDVGPRPSVRERAIAAATKLMNEHGLDSATLDAVATEAQCSVPSLHAVFGTRDGLLTAVFDLHGPLRALEALATRLPTSFEDRVRAIYQAFIVAFDREPQVLPALFADLLSRPDGPASNLLRAKMSHATRILEVLLDEPSKSEASRLPLTTMLEFLLGPLFFHALFTPRIWGAEKSEQLTADVLTGVLLCALSRETLAVNSTDCPKTHQTQQSPARGSAPSNR
jgi:AcrR family transcriptional regulator